MSTNGQSIGIIIPPPEIRKLADTTAQYIVNIGPSFEQMVVQKEQNNPQFCFMKLDDPYRAYFDHKISELAQIKKDEEEKQRQSLEIQGNIQSLVTDQNKQLEEQLQQSEIEKQKQLQDQEKLRKNLKAPEPDQYTVQQPKGLTQFKVDLIKHSAQFVAVNGKRFLVSLTEREGSNSLYDFLKPSNDLFTYFMALVEAYTKCKNIKKTDLEKIIKNYEDKMSILNNCGQIFEYENYKRQETRKQIEEGEEEKQKLAQVDWNDFVIVETIDFVDEEFQPMNEKEIHDINNIYEPIETKEIYEAKATKDQELLEQQRQEDLLRKEQEREEKLKQQIASENLDIEELKKKQKITQEEIEKQKQINQVTENYDADDNVELRTDYVPKTDKNQQQYSLCEYCNKMIPTKDMNEHIRIELMNPEAYQQKLLSSKASGSSAINQGDDIAANLASIKRKRPDIFREQGEDLAQQVFEEEEKAGEVPQKKIQWDGQDRNMTRTTANIAIMQHQERKKNLDLQKQYGGSVKVADQSYQPLNQNSTIAPNLQGNTQIQPGNLQTQQQLYTPEAPSLREQSIKVTQDGMIYDEGVGLKQEMDWLKSYPGDVKINLKIPEVDQEDIKFKRQTIQLTVPPTTSILQLKIQLAQQLKNLPAAKQRIRSAMFQNLRDEKSLAYYNIINNSNLQLELN